MYTKILITVRGGCIQEIISNNPAIDLTIVDWDNPSHETGCEVTVKPDAEIDALSAKYDNEIYNDQPKANEEKKRVYENEMCKAAGLMAACNSCDRIIFEGDKYFQGGYCEECAKDIEKENKEAGHPITLVEIETIL